ncbi:hypothetical protein ACWIGW_38905 [Nocardia brasiliensis]
MTKTGVSDRAGKWRSGIAITTVEGEAEKNETIRRCDREIPDENLQLLERAQEFFHNIRVEGSTTFHDYETFGSDEHGTFPFLTQNILSTFGPSITLLNWVRGFGGEERVELEVTGALNSATGVLIAQLAVRFYEGATEGTTELEDSDAWTSAVPVNGTSTFDITLANDEDDWARIVGTVSNQRLP